MHRSFSVRHETCTNHTHRHKLVEKRENKNRGFPPRKVHLHYISCLRYTILVGNPRNMDTHQILRLYDVEKNSVAHIYYRLLVGLLLLPQILHHQQTLQEFHLEVEPLFLGKHIARIHSQFGKNTIQNYMNVLFFGRTAQNKKHSSFLGRHTAV